MNRMILTGLAILVLTGFEVSGGNEAKTAGNLKSAFRSESLAAARYAAFAKQAKQEGYTLIAFMFEATARATQIHADNHQAVLEKMGSKPDPVKPGFAVKSTAENLRDAIAGETSEITAMYPGFISTAREEDAASAVKSFRWAMDTGKKHIAIYKKTLDALTAKTADKLSAVYWVCPKCGNAYDVKKPEKSCAFCSTGSDKYVRFGK
jgi:rubrerythrin